MHQGYFTFVLHTHLPYVRQAGRWPHGEEMLHEAMAETYIPLLNALYELKAEGYEPYLTIGFTPILLEQLADQNVLANFELYLQEKLELAQADIRTHDEQNHGHLTYLARFYEEWYRDLLLAFQDRYSRDIVGGFRELQEAGNLDIITGAATHGYLPLMERDSTIYAQLSTGLKSYRHHFGQDPQGIWLPECGYRPPYTYEGEKEYYKPGLEEFLADLDLHYFFTDSHVIAGGKLAGKVVGDVIGPYGGLPQRRLVVQPYDRPIVERGTTFRPYYVRSSPIAVYSRDERTGLQVWSAAHGYPGDFLYREFHRKDANSGLQYWRVTGADADLSQKELYDPPRAFKQAHYHASHFVGIVTEELANYHREHDEEGIVVSAYDTELFGHWWFEGIAWMKEVLRLFCSSTDVRLTRARDYLLQYPPQEVMNLPESSWGEGGAHWTWLNPNTEWMWPLIHRTERRMEALVEKHPDAGGDLRRVLNQAARELLLLEASDWPFLISTGQAKEYASGRFQGHLARFNHLAAIADTGQVTSGDKKFLNTAGHLDNPFAYIDYRVFANRERRS